ncbi:hypothetical protein GCM10027578_27690 [Spirosoma luteolum]
MKKFKTSTGQPPSLHRNTANLMQSMLDEVKASIVVLPELKALIPPLLTGEREQLSANIHQEGCREPLLIWQTTQGVIENSDKPDPINVLIDGHNRYEICTAGGIDFRIALKDFETMQAVREFMIDNQLGRRNLTPEQMSYLRGLRYRNEKLDAGRPTTSDTPSHTEVAPKKRTKDKLAETFSVSSRTILRDSEYASGIDRLEPELRQEVLSGARKLPKDFIRELGRSTMVDAGPLTSADLAAMSKSIPGETALTGESTPPPPAVKSRSGKLVARIKSMVGQLDPGAVDFGSQCDALIRLLEKAKAG